MEKITAEMTYRIMDSIAFAVVGLVTMLTGEEPSDTVIDSTARGLAALYCRSEELTPDYSMIGSPVDMGEDPCEDCDDDCNNCCYNDDYNEDEDEDEDDEDEDELSSMLETFVETLRRTLKGT